MIFCLNGPILTLPQFYQPHNAPQMGTSTLQDGGDCSSIKNIFIDLITNVLSFYESFF